MVQCGDGDTNLKRIGVGGGGGREREWTEKPLWAPFNLGADTANPLGAPVLAPGSRPPRPHFPKIKANSNGTTNTDHRHHHRHGLLCSQFHYVLTELLTWKRCKNADAGGIWQWEIHIR